MQTPPLLCSSVLEAVRAAPDMIGHRRGYRLMDRMARLIDPRLRGERLVVHRWGKMVYNMDLYIERLMAYELFGEELAELIPYIVRPGDTVVEAGTHIGHMSVLLLSCVGGEGRFIGYEAMPNSQERLKENLSLQGEAADCCTIHSAALHERGAETVTLYCADRESDSSLAPSSSAMKFQVPTVTFDGTLGSVGRVRFLKIDIEGAEVLALGGGVQWLQSERRPDYIFSEFNPHLLEQMGTSADALYRLYLSYGYRAWRVSWRGKGRALRASRLAEDASFPQNCDVLFCRDEALEEELIKRLNG